MTVSPGPSVGYRWVGVAGLVVFVTPLTVLAIPGFGINVYLFAV
jgi:hypothetical protein